MRAPTDQELDQLRHDVVSLAVRGGRRMEVVRVSCPDDLDRDAMIEALSARLAATPVGAVEVWTTAGDAVRVVGGMFA